GGDIRQFIQIYEVAERRPDLLPPGVKEAGAGFREGPRGLRRGRVAADEADHRAFDLWPGPETGGSEGGDPLDLAQALGDDAEGAVGLAAGGGEDAIGDLALDGDGHGVAPGVVDEEREKQGRSSAIGEVADEAERAAGDRLDDGGRQFALASEAVAFDEGEAGGGLNGPYG